MNIYDPIFLQAALDPLRPAVAYPGGLATYGSVARSANVVAANLTEMGIGPGQICTIRVRDPLLHLLIVLGLGRIGAVSLSLADLKPLDRFGLDIAASFVDGPMEGDHGGQVVVVTAAFYSESKTAGPFAAGIKGYRGTPSGLVSVCMSSGSTGRPKGIGLTNAILHQRALVNGGRGPDRRTLSMMGLDTLGGYVNALQTLRSGGTVCFAPQGPLVLEMASFFGVTDLIASPAQALALVAEQRTRVRWLPALRTIFIGGAQLPGDAQLEAERLFGAQIFIVYGSTEAGPIALAPSTMSDPGARTCGFPLPSLDVEVVDEAGHALPQGGEGLIRVRGPGVIGAYLNPSEEDSAMFLDGWFYPGDIGRIDANGMLHVTGRAGTRINRGGVKVAPEAIEEVLIRHPGIRDCAVTGLATLDGHMRILVAVIREDAAVPDEDLRSFCAAHIPDNVPDDFFEVAAIPKTSMGKIAREDLRVLLREIYTTGA